MVVMKDNRNVDRSLVGPHGIEAKGPKRDQTINGQLLDIFCVLVQTCF